MRWLFDLLLWLYVLLTGCAVVWAAPLCALLGIEVSVLHGFLLKPWGLAGIGVVLLSWAAQRYLLFRHAQRHKAQEEAHAREMEALKARMYDKHLGAADADAPDAPDADEETDQADDEADNADADDQADAPTT